MADLPRYLFDCQLDLPADPGPVAQVAAPDYDSAAELYAAARHACGRNVDLARVRVRRTVSPSHDGQPGPWRRFRLAARMAFFAQDLTD